MVFKFHGLQAELDRSQSNSGRSHAWETFGSVNCQVKLIASETLLDANEYYSTSDQRVYEWPKFSLVQSIDGFADLPIPMVDPKLLASGDKYGDCRYSECDRDCLEPSQLLEMTLSRVRVGPEKFDVS